MTRIAIQDIEVEKVGDIGSNAHVQYLIDDLCFLGSRLRDSCLIKVVSETVSEAIERERDDEVQTGHSETIELEMELYGGPIETSEKQQTIERRFVNHSFVILDSLVTCAPILDFCFGLSPIDDVWTSQFSRLMLISLAKDL